MTDDNNRIDGFPMTDDPVNAEDIPPTPEWEKAFAAYAAQQAPDLMPRILAKIQAAQQEQPAPTTEPVKEPEPVRITKPVKASEPKKQNRGPLSRLFKIITDNPRRVMMSLSGVAAAVIIIGLLVIMNNSIGRPKERGSKDEVGHSSASTPTPAITNSGSKDAHNGKQSSPTTPVPANEHRDDEHSISDDPYNGGKGEPGESVPAEKEELAIHFSNSGKLSADDLSASTTYTLTDVTLKEFSAPTYSTVPSDSAKEGSTTYRVIRDGQETNILLICDDAAAGQTYSEMTLKFVSTMTVNGELFTVFRVIQ